MEDARWPATVAPVTRFAPSPTGFLHLGHVANAVWTWGIAGAAGGRVLLRIEDHDRGRCRPAYEAAILEDLDWLGFEADAGSRHSLHGRPSIYRQSDNDSEYGAAVERLRAAAQVYVCRCSRAGIARQLVADGHRQWDELRYPGTCRSLGLAPAEGTGLRVVLGEESVTFRDARLGPQEQTPAGQCGDLLLRDPTGCWTYQLSVTVDDARHGVNLVIRGEDLLASTGRQILLARMLGRTTAPCYLHHPLVTDGAGAKLSKRDQATGVRELRAAGRSPEQVVGEAAWRTGLQRRNRPIPAGDLPSLFDGITPRESFPR